VCVCVCGLCVHICKCVYTHNWVCFLCVTQEPCHKKNKNLYTYIHTHAYIHMYIYISICTYVCIYMYSSVYIYVYYIYICICIHLYIYEYIYVYMNVYIYIYILIICTNKYIFKHTRKSLTHCGWSEELPLGEKICTFMCIRKKVYTYM